MNLFIKASNMTLESSESTPPVSPPNSPQKDCGVIVATSIAVVATVFSLFFLMGFVSAWLKIEGDWMALVMRGLKLGASGSLGVVCIGISAKSWQQLPVPAWLPATASFAVGFFVMNGMGELLDGRHENILPKAGGGFLAGCLGGFGLYWIQKKGLVKPAAFGTPSVRTEEREHPDGE
jgi:hypothetical protein